MISLTDVASAQSIAPPCQVDLIGLEVALEGGGQDSMTGEPTRTLWQLAPCIRWERAAGARNTCTAALVSNSEVAERGSAS